MKFSTAISLLATTAVAQNQLMVPVPWVISSLSISNIRHGTGGWWSFNIVDTPTLAPQGFNTTCSYHANTYVFALDGPPPYNEPCSNPNVTFGLFPNANHEFTFNVTHVYECGKTSPCTDNGTWSFSWDDVRGQEDDVQNNFGQAGGFSRSYISMYPTRAVASSKCEFC
ncbi:hypothetical protein BDZ45DRAFT_619755 [Acephala macrosclerotiorum]|nr:hypothetical protein BDZ45DRAFT_619755 [Acephala macrosclerotiorum]